MKNNYDVAVIGGGPAGMIAAIGASEAGAKTALIEKNDVCGKKLLLTGNGRCNITNAEFDLRKLVGNYGGNGPFLFHAFFEFGPRQAIEFFNGLGVQTVIEERSRVFPKNGKAADVLSALLEKMRKNGVDLVCQKKLTGIKKEGNSIKRINLADIEIAARNYILATGGKSYPSTGSTGEGYDFAHDLGHRIVKLTPALVPVKTRELWSKQLQGLSLEEAGIAVFSGNKKIHSAVGDCLFTHFGLSGPAILDASAKIGEFAEKGPITISINLLPQIKSDDLEKRLMGIFATTPNKTLKNCLAEIIKQAIAPAICELANANPDKTANDVTREERKRITRAMQDIRLAVTGLLGVEAGMVTNGGAATEFIDDKTMRSKIIDNLFFAGEIINVHGRTGGFNLQQCWSTGMLAGKSAANIR